MTRQLDEGQRGFVLLAVATTLALIATIAFLLNRENAMHVRVGAAFAQKDRAHYVAVAGLQHQLWRLNQADCTGYTNLPPTPFGGNTYTATVTPTENSPVTITAVGVLASGARQIHQRADVAVFAAPVTITAQPGSPGKDTYLSDGASKNWNFSNSNDLMVNNRGSNVIHTVIEFGLPSALAGARVDSAILELNLERAADINNGVLDVHRVTQAWTETGATYESFDGTNPWGTPGGDYDPAVEASASIPNATPSRHQWNITGLVKGWLDGTTPNLGLLIRASAGLVDKAEFTSSDDSSAGDRPKLILSYAFECATGGVEVLPAVADTDIEEPGIRFPTYTAEAGEINLAGADIATCDLGARRDSIPGWANWSEASAAEYANLQSSNDTYFQTPDPTSTREAAMLFEFAVANDPNAALEINLSVEAAQESSIGALRFCLWNYSTSRYDALNRIQNTSDTVLTRRVVSPPGAYVNPADGQMTLLLANDWQSEWFRVDTLSVAIRNASGSYLALDGEIDVADADVASGNFGARRDTIPGWTFWDQATPPELVNLQGSNDAYYQTIDPGTGDNAALLFELYASEDRTAVTQIDLSVEAAQADDKDPVYFYLWDYDAGQYDVLGSLQTKGDLVFTASLTTNPGRYVNPGDGQLTLFIVNQDTDKWVRVDTLSVSITASALTPGRPWDARHALLHFDVLSSLPPAATIQSAQLRVHEFANNGNNPYAVRAHKITQDWTEAGADWLTADGSTPWTGGPGGSVDPSVIDSDTVNRSQPGWRTWDLTALVQEWVNGSAPDYGVQLIPETGSEGNWAEFESWEAAGNTPELVVVYTP